MIRSQMNETMEIEVILIRRLLGPVRPTNLQKRDFFRLQKILNQIPDAETKENKKVSDK